MHLHFHCCAAAVNIYKMMRKNNACSRVSLSVTLIASEASSHKPKEANKQQTLCKCATLIIVSVMFSIWSAAVIVGHIALVQATTVTFDGRSFLIDNNRQLFVSGSIHYPRTPRSEWRTVLQQAKDNGINLIQTYVFWDIHEPKNNEWNFPSDPTSSNDLVAFVQEAANLNLYVHLRIAGYICAEWNFGNFTVQ